MKLKPKVKAELTVVSLFLVNLIQNLYVTVDKEVSGHHKKRGCDV